MAGDAVNQPSVHYQGCVVALICLREHPWCLSAAAEAAEVVITSTATPNNRSRGDGLATGITGKHIARRWNSVKYVSTRASNRLNCHWVDPACLSGPKAKSQFRPPRPPTRTTVRFSFFEAFLALAHVEHEHQLLLLCLTGAAWKYNLQREISVG
mmetsp:Transcript_42434/g.70369  ORF Transcript_42434/g.70369 Transcript_42434/m.70369 type:complete len:155 (+) Transcript_42434:15-479(+)